MIENFYYISEFIRTELLVGFGIYSLLKYIYGLLYNFNDLKTKFDDTAQKVAAIFGLIVTSISLAYLLNLENFRPISMIQPLIWTVFCLTLLYSRIGKYTFIRLLFSIAFLITIERFIIIITSLHRDYLYSSWSDETFDQTFGTSTVLINLSVKLVEFLVSTGFFFWINKKRSTTAAIKI